MSTRENTRPIVRAPFELLYVGNRGAITDECCL